MAGKQYEATGSFSVGGDEVTHYDDGDVVSGAADFANLDVLLAEGRLREHTARRSSAKAPAATDEAAAPAKAPAKKSGSRSRAAVS